MNPLKRAGANAAVLPAGILAGALAAGRLAAPRYKGATERQADAL